MDDECQTLEQCQQEWSRLFQLSALLFLPDTTNHKNQSIFATNSSSHLTTSTRRRKRSSLKFKFGSSTNRATGKLSGGSRRRDHDDVDDNEEDNGDKLDIDQDEIDPFDCSDIVVPPIYESVDHVVREYVEQWQALDERKISAGFIPRPVPSLDVLRALRASPASATAVSTKATASQTKSRETTKASVASTDRASFDPCPNDDNVVNHLDPNGTLDEDLDDNLISPTDATVDALMHILDEKPNRSRSHKRLRQGVQGQALPTWYEKHIRLPEKFDYATRQEHPPTDDPAMAAFEDRVVSLEDPTRTYSYPVALWHLFAQIPTAQQIDQQQQQDHQMPHTSQVYQECIEQTQQNPRLDAHGLTRLRMSDRHDLIPLPAMLPTDFLDAWKIPMDIIDTKPGGVAVAGNVTDPPRVPHDHHGWTMTVRLECWRRQLKRASTPDPNRAVLEFQGYQTLLDVHQSIIELAQDDLWDQKVKQQHQQTGDDHHHDSGMFFIENVFYITGSVDYAKPVQAWLCSGSLQEQQQRAIYLGHSGTGAAANMGCPAAGGIRDMADVQLQHLPLRLGIRYMHVHHGDVECSIFCTDRRFLPPVTIAQTITTPKPLRHFPILHDIWTWSNHAPKCHVCQQRQAVTVTRNDCARTDHQHAALCRECVRHLRLIPQRDLETFAIWRHQADLSVGASNENVF